MCLGISRLAMQKPPFKAPSAKAARPTHRQGMEMGRAKRNHSVERSEPHHTYGGEEVAPPAPQRNKAERPALDRRSAPASFLIVSLGITP
jgi:hypothetical protein